MNGAGAGYRTIGSLTMLAFVALAEGQALGADSSNPARSVAASGGSAVTERADEEASIRFRRGLERFDDGDYALALVEFERAYQLAPNYKALYNIALVNMQLGRYASAYHSFAKYLHDGGAGISDERRREVNLSLESLSQRTATVEISTDVAGADVSLDGKSIETSELAGPILVDVGEHTLGASAPGHIAVARSIVLAGADHATVHIDLPVQVRLSTSLPVPDSGSHGAFWPGFVGAGVFAVGAAVSGIAMLEAGSSLTTLKNTPGSDPSARAHYASQFSTDSVVADVFSGLALVSGGVSIYLSLRPTSSRARASIGLALDHVSISGAF